MSVVRGTALSNYPGLVAELGGDPTALLRAAGIQPADVGRHDVFIPFRGVIEAIESAAATTQVPDFGRRLAQLQGIEILGPVGVAARTAATVADALSILENFISAYSPALALRVSTSTEGQLSFVEFAILDTNLPPHPQGIELSLGVTLRVLRFLLGSDYAPRSVHLPHEPLTPAAEYRRDFGCRPRFAEHVTGFTLCTADLHRSLHRDELTHQIVVQYLADIISRGPATSQSVHSLVRQLLPSGSVTLELIAAQLNLHPKALQRRLAAEDTTFAALVDGVRREATGDYLRNTDITLSHLARELGYAEQSVLTRSCRRWFGCGPAAHRNTLHGRPSSAVRP